MRGDRFELMPFRRALDEAAKLPEPVRLTVTCSPKHGLDESVAVAKELRRLGHEVTLHLAARMVRSEAHLDGVLAEMTEAGIDDAFVIGGDADPPSARTPRRSSCCRSSPSMSGGRRRSGSPAIPRATR